MSELALPASVPPLSRVTVVIVNYNSGPWLERCIRALRGKGANTPSIEIVDNDSRDDSIARLPEWPALRIRRAPRNLGFARGVNTAARAVQTDYLLIINPDCLIVPEALTRLVADLDAHPQAGLVSGRIFDMHGTEQRGSRRMLPSRRRVWNEALRRDRNQGIDRTHLPPPDLPAEVEAVSGACMLLRREAFLAVGGLDKHYPMHFEDLDLMVRLAAAGWTVRLLPDVVISHAGGVSSRSRPVRVMWNKHRGLWRYLNQHPEQPWPAWNRALWWLGIHAHAVMMAPFSLWRRP